VNSVQKRRISGKTGGQSVWPLRDLVVVRDHPLDLGNPVRLSARHEVLACNRSSSGTCGICAVATVSTTTRLCSTLLQ
jgi:hypothetical protein